MQFGWLIAVSVLTSVAAQTSFKLGLGQFSTSNSASGLPFLIGFIAQSPLVLVGLLLYGLGALSWLAVLSRVHLSYAYPFLALNFVLIALTSRFVLAESIPPTRWLGMAIICVGILVVARSR